MIRIPLIGSAALLLLVATTHADIAGFGDFSNFSINVLDGGSAPTISPGTIHLTNTGLQEARSVIAKTPQTITQFTASFTYQNAGVPGAGSGLYGASFVLENSSLGTSAIGLPSSQLGYGSLGFISKSAAITLEINPAPTASGFYTDGNLGGGSPVTSPVNLISGDPINVTLAYNGTTLHENLFDTTTSASYDAFFVANLTSVLGGSTAFVGVTASTSNVNEVSQTFSNFAFTSGAPAQTPEPASLGILGCGIIGVLTRRRR